MSALHPQKTPSPAAEPPSNARFIELEAINPFVRIAREVVCEGGHQTGRRQIPDYEFALVLEGEGHTEWDGRKHPFAAGDLLYYRPYRWHNFASTGPALLRHIVVHFDYSPRLRQPRWRKSSPPPDIVIRGTVPFPLQTRLPARSPLLGMFKQITECNVDSAWGRFRAKGILVEILHELVTGPFSIRRAVAGDEPPADAVNRERIRRALEFIDQHYAEPLTLPQMAARVGLSPTHFLRTFKMVMGRTPIEFLIRIRIREAKRLLGDVRLSVGEVGYRVGYNDPHYFARQFRTSDGLSPREYRAMVLGGKH
ncbi:MAG: AraC family transcriptional regulator [Verrucomicrobia bacterium]|nr:AraC family transcriptional regulator [Verrucomicrobiota bacterium]